MAIATFISLSLTAQATRPLLSMRLTAEHGLVTGDSFTLQVTVGGLPLTVTLTKAWMTVKTLQADADPGIFQKAITTTAVTDVGQITDDGTDSTTAVLQFDCTVVDTALLTALSQYFWDCQVRCSDGTVHTVIGESTLIAGYGITAAVS